jgi:hypothetical protein
MHVYNYVKNNHVSVETVGIWCVAFASSTQFSAALDLFVIRTPASRAVLWETM